MLSLQESLLPLRLLPTFMTRLLSPTTAKSDTTASGSTVALMPSVTCFPSLHGAAHGALS